MSPLWEKVQQRMQKGEYEGLYGLHPELLNREPLLRVYSDEAGVNPIGTGAYLKYYTANTWVHKAIKIVSENIAKLNIRVIQKVEGEASEPLPEHELSQLLEAPNPSQDSNTFWKEWSIVMLLLGEIGLELTYNLAQSAIVEMWPRMPETIGIIPGPQGYRYRKVSQYRITDNWDDPYVLSPEEMLFYKFFNPRNPWRGLAPIAAVRMGVVIDELAQAWTRLFFKNQARPDYAVIAPEGITQSEKNEIYERLDQQVGADQVHKPLILEEGITDIKTFSFPPKDIEWIEQRKFSRDEVGALFGVPDEIMGYGKDTYENFDAADRVLWTLTITPLVSFRDDALTHKFRALGKLEVGQQVQTDLSQVPQLQEDKTAKVEQLDKLANRSYPVNALNSWLGLGLPEITGGDVGYLPAMLIPSTSTNGQGAPKMYSVAALPSITVTKRPPRFGSDEHVRIWKAAQDEMEPFVKRMQRLLKKEFQRQQMQIDQKLRDSQMFGRGKFVKQDNIPPVESLFDPQAEAALFALAFTDMIQDTTEQIGQLTIEDVLASGSFDVTRPEVQAGIQHVLQTVAIKTNETTWNDLTSLFQEAEAAGEGITAIQERLRSYFGDRKSDWQTERIARTTMGGASNLAKLEAWVQSGVTKAKTWVSALIPNRTRADHAAAHGQTRALREAFEVGGELLMEPGDPAGSPGNIINCLCTMVPEVENGD